jgi:hypothetical protein
MKKLQGLDVSALPEEHDKKSVQKSRLLIEARLLWEREEFESAVDLYAKVASLEEELMQLALDAGVSTVFFIHAFSGAYSWIRAGNYYQARQICRAILSRPEITPPLQEKANLLLADLNRGIRSYEFSKAA